MGYREQKVRELLQKCVDAGYRAYIVPEDERLMGGYGYIITPSDHVLYVQYEKCEGYSFSLQYKPSARTGTGVAVTIEQWLM